MMNTSAKLVRVLQRLDKACNTVCKNAPNSGLRRPKVDAIERLFLRLITVLCF